MLFMNLAPLSSYFKHGYNPGEWLISIYVYHLAVREE